MSQVIPISQVNAVYGQPNQFTYQFPSGSQTFRSRKVAIANMIIPYEWYNVSTNYSNTTGIALKFPTGSTTQTINLTFPNSFYTITQLNSYLQSQMIANKFYKINGSTNTYYLEIVANSNTGLAQLNCYDIPTTNAYESPAVSPTTANQVPQLIITNANFGNLIGFSTGTFPASPTQATTYSVQSSFQPQISPVSSLYVCLSCVNNELSSPNNIVSVVPITATFGAQIVFTPPEFIWVKALDGVVSNITLSLYDQNMRALPLLDTNLTANILIQ